MSRPTSVFEGWTKKIEHRNRDYDGGFCATGYLAHVGQHMPCDELRSIYERIGRWIQENMDPPLLYGHAVNNFVLMPLVSKIDAIVWANNTCALDIEGFKMADLLSQGYVPEEPEPEPVPVGKELQ